MALNSGSNYGVNASRENVASGGRGWNLLSFTIFVFAAVLLSYLGLVFGYKNFVQNQIEKKDKEIEELAAQVPKAEQDDYLTFRFQLINLEKLLGNHVIASKILPLLEANTNQKIYYTSLNLDIKERRLNLEAVAQTYETAAEQLAAFQRLREVARYETSGVKTAEGGRVQFNASLFLTPEVFK